MTTATIEKAAPAASATLSPADPDIVSAFYGPESDEAAANSALPVRSQTDSEPGPSTTSESASVVSAERVETKSSATGTAETKEQNNKSEEKGDESGHRAAAGRLGKEVKDLSAKLDEQLELNKVLQAKIDGTYKEPEAPTPEQIRARAEFAGREQASRIEAERVHGAAVVKEKIYDPGSAYEKLVQEKPWLQARVMRHPQPTVEAMHVLETEAFMAKYGEDPAQWVTKIEAELTPKLLDTFKQQTQAPPTGAPAPTVTESRGSGGPGRERSITDLFYGSEAKS